MPTTAVKQLKPESWGDRLKRATGRNHRAAVAAIAENVGPLIGTRNTFAKLYSYDEAPGADDPTDRIRGWLLLVTLGYEPSDWGIDADVLPPAWDAERVRDLLFSRIGWSQTMSSRAA